jgi:Mn-dependent DtxR family transcriptional regulator
VTSLASSAEERYLEFVRTYPGIVQRVPQWMLASYLGVSPETVSRIRKNLSRK